MKFYFSKFEKKIAVVPKRVWLKMLEIARDFDIEKGGHFDARAGAINIWVSEDDKPIDYEFKITRGCLKEPRAYLASLYARHIDDERVELYLVIHNYARRDFARYLLNHSNISWETYRSMLELSERGTDEEWKWTINKAWWLIKLAEAEKVFVKVLYCPFCGLEFPTSGLLNEFIEHLSTHTKVTAIIFDNEGVIIQTELGTMKPEDFVRVKVER